MAEQRHNHNRTLKLLVFILTSVLFGIVVWFLSEKYYQPSKPRMTTEVSAGDIITGLLQEGDVLEQEIQYVGDVYGVVLQLGTYGSQPEGSFELEVCNSSGDTASATLDLSDVSDLEKCTIELDHAVSSQAPGDCVLTVYVEELGDDIQISLVGEAQTDNQDEQGQLFFNQEETGALMNLSVIGFSLQSQKILSIFLFVMFCLWLVTMVAEYLLMFRHFKTHHIFLLLALMYGMLYQMVLPPLTAPDEDAHASMAYYYSNFFWGEMRSEADEKPYSYIPSQETEDILQYATKPQASDYLDLLDSFSEKGPSKIQFDSEMKTRLVHASFVTYLPQTIGVTLGRVLHLNATLTLYLGRMLSMATYLALCYFGIKMMPAYSCTLALVALLPMSMHLGASYSYDSILLGGAIFFTGLVFNLYARKERLRMADWAKLLLSAVILTAGKGIYILLLGLCLILPAQVWGSRFHKVQKLAAFYIVSAMLFVVNMMPLLQNRAEKSGSAEMLSAGMALERPLEFIWLLINTLVERISWYVQSMLGGYLGWLETPTPVVVVYLALFLILASIVRSSENRLELTVFTRVVCIVTFLAIGGGSMVAAMSWNKSSVEVIDGVQGRYLLEALPALALGCAGWKGLELKKNVDRQLLLGMCAVNICALIGAFNTFATR